MTFSSCKLQSLQSLQQQQHIMHDQILSPSDPNMLATCLRPSLQDRRLKPHADQILKCPRCDSLNTKFCYYNNYSLTQPRHFCKNCKRYWTQGGVLRNVPVGGGCRSSKNKRTSKQQRSTDQYHHTTTPSPASHAEDDQRLFSGCNIHGDGSSSSSSLQQDFSARASTERDGAFGLTFERLDQATRAFSVSTAPFSINWQAPATFNLPPFDSNMLALNLTGHHLKQEATNHPQNSDLTSMYESHLNLVAPPSSLHENIPAYNLCLESCGVAGSNVDLQWRLPPRLVTVAEEEEGSNGRQLMQSMEDVERVRPAKGKLPLECIPVSSTELHEHGWHPPEDGFFEATADGGYWNNGSWPPDLTMYGMAGSQLL